jgi:2-keto-4-pentenoate hydratase/2-oxohepta-3-ene-1,7-dioic acid hydratase in catechol pathway
MRESSVAGTVWRFGSVGQPEHPQTVIERDGQLYYLDRILNGDSVGRSDVFSILLSWDEWLPRLRSAVEQVSEAAAVDRSSIEWLPPVVYPRKLICIGANYSDHLAEMKADVTNKAPYAFLKPSTTGLIGSGRPMHLPASATWIDWEGELAVVIGRQMRHVKGDDVFDGVAGYAQINDVSNRDGMDDWQPIVGMDWVVHKGFDEFAPAGPLITPAEFVPDPQDLDLEVRVNGVVKQQSNTSKMIFAIQPILEHLSSVMTLQPGDMIATGTPSGVGYGREPRERLQAGDEVSVAVEALGEVLVTPVVSANGGDS